MDLISQAVFELLWEMGSSEMRNCETGESERGGTIDFASLEIGPFVGTSQYGVLDRLAHLGHAKFWYIEPPGHPPFISYQLYNTPKVRADYVPLAQQVRRWQYDDMPTLESPETKDDSGYVYIIKGKAGHYKIGHTKNPADRYQTFKLNLPFEVEYLHLILCGDRHAAESTLHQCFAHRRVPGTEWFKLTASDIEVFTSIRII